MKYVLIYWIFASGAPGAGAATGQVEFITEQACNLALEKLEARYRTFTVYPYGICVER